MAVRPGEGIEVAEPLVLETLVAEEIHEP